MFRVDPALREFSRIRFKLVEVSGVSRCPRFRMFSGDQDIVNEFFIK